VLPRSKKADNRLGMLQLAGGLIAFKKARAARLAAAPQGYVQSGCVRSQGVSV